MGRIHILRLSANVAIYTWHVTWKHLMWRHFLRVNVIFTLKNQITRRKWRHIRCFSRDVSRVDRNICAQPNSEYSSTHLSTCLRSLIGLARAQARTRVRMWIRPPGCIETPIKLPEKLYIRGSKGKNVNVVTMGSLEVGIQYSDFLYRIYNFFFFFIYLSHWNTIFHIRT